MDHDVREVVPCQDIPCNNCTRMREIELVICHRRLRVQVDVSLRVVLHARTVAGVVRSERRIVSVDAAELRSTGRCKAGRQDAVEILAPGAVD